MAVGLAFVAVLVLGTAGFALLRPDDPPTHVSVGPELTSSTTESATPSPTPSLSPSTSPSASRTPTAARTKNPVPTAPPTTKPPAAEKPPAPVPQPTTANPGCTPTYNGTNASKTEVRDALVQAGAKQYWQGVQLPADYVGPLVPITVPANLMKAIAWQESGWQSAIVACDGGIGTMQLMAGTVSQINNRFGENYNPNTLTGNTELGANYLEWLMMYFGLYYYGQNFDLSVTAPVGKGKEQLALLDVVVAAYNVGPSALENSDNSLSIPNWQYVNNVEALMTNCECLSY
jgi:soluble lytic murein transglycosylase-like protein